MNRLSDDARQSLKLARQSQSPGEARQWVKDAIHAGWTDLSKIVEAGQNDGANDDGLWRCDACNAPVLDPGLSQFVGCGVLFTAHDGFGDTVLCMECADGEVGHDAYHASIRGRLKQSTLSERAAAKMHANCKWAKDHKIECDHQDKWATDLAAPEADDE